MTQFTAKPPEMSSPHYPWMVEPKPPYPSCRLSRYRTAVLVDFMHRAAYHEGLGLRLMRKYPPYAPMWRFWQERAVRYAKMATEIQAILYRRGVYSLGLANEVLAHFGAGRRDRQ